MTESTVFFGRYVLALAFHENATASAFPVATRPELVDRSRCRELQSASGGRLLTRFHSAWICNIGAKISTGESFHNP